MGNCIAVMDLGTNTFHLMIAELTDGGFKEIARDHEAVRLGEGGINNGYIQQNAFDRGVKTIERFNKQIKQHNVNQVRAIATSAIRSASNGKDFMETVKQRTGIEIEIIDGIKEATFIYEGVKASGALSAETSLIMDIGGGSVEFIICTQTDILWKRSYEIGAARLIERFQQVDPMPADAIKDLHQYLGDTLAGLFEAAITNRIDKLIGSAGAFETFTEVIELKKQEHFDAKSVKTYEFDIDELIETTDRLIASSNQERKAMKGIISLRVDMIVVASILTRYIMDRLSIQHVGMTTYSLKEGVVAGFV